jgi:hypothetical protein
MVEAYPVTGECHMPHADTLPAHLAPALLHAADMKGIRKVLKDVLGDGDRQRREDLCSKFEKEGITDLAIAAQLGEEQLKDLGVETMGLRLRLQAALRGAAAQKPNDKVAQLAKKARDKLESTKYEILLKKGLNVRFARIDVDNDGTITQGELDSMKDEIEGMVESLLNYWTSVGVVSALILSMTMPMVLEGAEPADYDYHYPADYDNYYHADDSHHYNRYALKLTASQVHVLNGVYVQCLWFASAGSLASIMICLQYYILTTVVMIDLSDKIWLLGTIPIDLPSSTMGVSAAVSLVGVICGITAVHSPRQGLACAGVMLAVMFGTVGLLCAKVVKPVKNYLQVKVDDMNKRKASIQAHVKLEPSRKD